MNKTGIEYLDYTWNVTHGCTPVSDGCKNCWAKGMSKRLAAIGQPGYDKLDPFKVTCRPDRLDDPLKVKKPSRIGVSFMGDLFHEDVPFEFIDKVLTTITLSPQHTFLILTKRSKRMKAYFNMIPDIVPESERDYSLWDAWRATYGTHQNDKPEYPLNNVMLGVSVEDQKSLSRAYDLVQIPAAKHFISFEPLLEDINVPNEILAYIDLVIMGCESGNKRRMPEYKRALKDLIEQCSRPHISIFVKQWEQNGKVVKMPVINGKVYDQFPE